MQRLHLRRICIVIKLTANMVQAKFEIFFVIWNVAIYERHPKTTEN